MKNFLKNKGFLLFAVLLSFAMSALLSSYTPSAPADKYPYGKRGAATITYASTIEVAPNNLTQLVAICTLTGNVTANVTEVNSIVGDQLILKLAASGANRLVDFNTNFTAVDDSVLSGKTKVFEFIYDGSTWIQVAEVQIN